MADKRISELPTTTLQAGDQVAIRRGVGNYAVDITGYYGGTNGASLIGTSSGLSVEAAIALKADNSALAGKANTTSLAANSGATLIGTSTGATVEASLASKTTSATLAATGGAALVGGNDGASGSLWTTIQGFINYLKSSAGSVLVGFLQSGTGATARTLQAKERDVLHAADFGVVGNGSTDDTSALQLAINEASSSGRSLLLPPVLKCGALTVPVNTHIRGVGNKTKITAISGTYSMFTITGSDVLIENIYIDDTAKSGGYDFTIACSTNTLNRVDVHNVNVFKSWGLLTDSGTGTGGAGSWITARWVDVQTQGHRGPGVNCTRAYAYIWFERVSIDYVTVSASDYTGFYFDLGGMGGAAGGLTMIDCDVLGTCGVYNNANQHGYDIRNTAAVWMVRCKADTVAGIGFSLNNVNGIHQTDCIASLCGADGYVLTTVFNSNFVGLQAWGRNYLTPTGSGCDGVRIVSGCYTLNFTGGTISSWGRHGFNKSAVQTGAIRVTGMYMNSNGLAGVGYGVNSTGNSALSLIGCGFGSNQQGNGNIQGTFDYYGMCQLNSGAGNQSGVGPVTF